MDAEQTRVFAAQLEASGNRNAALVIYALAYQVQRLRWILARALAEHDKMCGNNIDPIHWSSQARQTLSQTASTEPQ
jgi:hypothetical protein